jgi:hypothetical protein
MGRSKTTKAELRRSGAARRMNKPRSSLTEAKAWLRDRLDDGAECPCCTQYAKVYRRHLNSAMAYALLLISKHFRKNEAWLHVPTFLNGQGVVARGGDFAKLVHWGLLEAQQGERDDGSSRVGYYVITPKGIAFVENRVRVPKFIRIYDGKPMKPSEERVNIIECLGKHFDYEELMGS